MDKKEQKILFIMQEATPGTHMDYVYEMARTLKEEQGLPLTLLLEKGGAEEKPEWVIEQKYRNPVLRTIENFYLILKARIDGTKTFYVHYSFLSAISAGIVSKLSGATVYYWNAGMPWKYKRPWYEEQYQRLAYTLINVLVTGAEALRVPYHLHYGVEEDAIEIIPNWIDLENIHLPANKNLVREALGLPTNKPLLLFVHKLAMRKGAHWLLPLMEKLKETNCHLVIAGDGPEEDNIKREIHALGLEEKVTMLGRVDRETASKLYQAANIFVMPSEEEGSPHSLIEAMAYGLPSVTFSVGGVKNTVPPEAYQFTFKYGDIDGFADGVSTLLYDKTVYQKQQIAASEWVHNFDKKTAVAAFTTLLTTDRK